MATTAKFWAHQFVDSSGSPYAGVKVYHYVSGTSTDKDAWVDSGKSATANQPVQGDSRGVVWFYGDGNYRLKVTTSDDILLYDFQDVDVLGRTTGTASRIPYFATDGTLTESANLTYNETLKRLGIGTATNLTERIVMPTNSYLGAERSTASLGEGARKLIGFDSNDRVALDPDGQGIVLNPLSINSLLYIDSSGILRTLTLVNGQVIIGSTGAAPVIAEISAGSGITITKSAGGISIAATGASVLNRTATSLTIGNTITETSLYNFTVTQNILSTNKMLKIVIFGSYLNDSAGTRTIILRIKYGATTLYQDTSNTLGNSANRRAFFFIIYLANQGATNSQVLGGKLDISDDVAATTGLGDIGASASGDVFTTPIYGSATEDSTADKTFDVTVVHSVANANLEIVRQYASATLL